MSWSLGETSALALKATRGAGLSWGLAEEAAGAVAWLHERGLPGVAALCSYLGAIADASSSRTETGLSPADRERVQRRHHRSPIRRRQGRLILAVSCHRCFFCLSSPRFRQARCGWRRENSGRRTDTTRPLAKPVASWEAPSCHGATVPQIGQAGALQHMRTPEQFGCCIERLTHFAHRTYAPATSASRLFRGRCRPYRQ